MITKKMPKSFFYEIFSWFGDFSVSLAILLWFMVTMLKNRNFAKIFHSFLQYEK
jgi:hypothetical protein